MIGDVFCNDNSKFLKNQRDRLERAKVRIINFPILNSIFNGFKDYEIMLSEGKSLPKNIVFILISNDNYENTYTQRNLLQSAGTVNAIKELEDAINQFFISNPDSSKEYELFCTRLNDHDNFTSAQPYHEITTAYEIGVKIGFENVGLFSPAGSKKPDLLLFPNGKRIFLELTALETRTPEKKITEIASAIANYILKKTTKKDYLISIMFDTNIVNQFKDDRGYILEKEIITYLKEKIDQLRLTDLIGVNGSFDFHDRQIHLHGEKKLLFPTPVVAIIQIEREYDENESLRQSIHLEIIDSSKIEKDLKDYQLIKSWANTIPLNDFLNSPFDTIIYSTDENNECVYINSLDFDSTDEKLKDSYLVSTSQIAKKSFISHIKRRINDKAESSQFGAGSPFVIGIQGSQWQYEYEWDYDDFIPLRNEIQEHLKKYPQISGIILFTFDLFHGRLIENPIAHHKITSELFDKSGILVKHYELLFTHDRKVDLSKLNYDQKEIRIPDLISQEPLVIQNGNNGFANEDLEELIQNIRDFLGEKNVKQEVLLAIEPIIIKYCTQKSEKEDDPVRRNESLSHAGMFLTGVPLRAYAAQALLRLERHLQSIKYLSLIEQLAEDENTYVRMHVADHLGYYFNCDPEKCMSLGKKFCLDNKYVRYFLTPFLTFLAQYHRTECLELICIIVKTYGKEDLKAESEGLILETAVDIATQLWIMVGDNNYQSLFEELVSGTYNSSVKRKLITKYLLKVINLNEFLVRSYKVGIVIKVLEKIFDSNIDLSLKKEAKLILDKVDKRIYWKAENIAEKIKDL